MARHISELVSLVDHIQGICQIHHCGPEVMSSNVLEVVVVHDPSNHEIRYFTPSERTLRKYEVVLRMIIRSRHYQCILIVEVLDRHTRFDHCIKCLSRVKLPRDVLHIVSPAYE